MPKRHDRTGVLLRDATDRIIPKGRLRGRSRDCKENAQSGRHALYAQNAKRAAIEVETISHVDEVWPITACQTMPLTSARTTMHLTK